MIRIRYLSVGRDAQHEHVLQLISAHCENSYTESSRVELRGWTTVEAECTGDAASF